MGRASVRKEKLKKWMNIQQQLKEQKQAKKIRQAPSPEGAGNSPGG